MSYSFSVRGATKDEVLEKVAAEMKKVVAGQPVHAHDEGEANAAARSQLSVIQVIDAPEGKEFSVSLSGSLGWTGEYPGTHQIISANTSCSAGLVDKA